jgi:SAM-dependent methyltransferase
MSSDEYIETNRLHWDDRARLHARGSTGYRLDRYRENRRLLSDVVDFDRQYLGDLAGLRVLHLQCHIGTDTLSLARLGADVVGLDQSGDSLRAARDLFASVDTPGTFVEANVYDAVDALDGEQFDLVYTGVGAINWLPDIARWGEVCAALVKPGGRFHMREGHPMGYAVDDTLDAESTNEALRLKYPYFQTVEPMTFDDSDTYVDTAGEKLTHTRHHEWNHGLGEVFTALTSAGLVVTTLEEHRHLDWKLLPNQIERDGIFSLPDHQIDLCPMMYTIAATRPG